MNRTRIILLLLISCVWQQKGLTQDTLAYSLVMGGRVKGFSKIWKQPDGSFRNQYQYNDRGRGDSLFIDYRLNSAGYPTRIRTTGVDYMKNVVNEQFEWDGARAHWSNAAENETRTLQKPAYYLGLKGSPESFVKTMLESGGRIQLLPMGEANGRIIFTRDFGAASGGPISLVMVEGLSLAPAYIWVDAQKREFATVSDWFTQIRQGSESLAPELLQIQNEKQQAYFADIVKTFRGSGSAGTCFVNVSLFDSEKGVVIPGSTVCVSGNKITSVYRGKAGSVPKGYTVIDGKGRTLLPGLWDMHTHMSDDTEGFLHLAAGVTSIRDMGNGENLLKRIESIKTGAMIGPEEAIISGFIDGAGPFAAPTGALINNLDEGREAIRNYARKGYQQIKLYSSIRPEWVRPLIEEARKHSLRVCGHIPAFMTATQAIEAGYDEVTHMNMLVLNFFGDTIDTRSTGRFIIPASKAAGLDLAGPEMTRFIELLRSRNIVVDPTLAVFEELLTGRDGVISPSVQPAIDKFPALVQRNFRAGGGGLPVPAGMDSVYKASFEAMLRILKKLYDAGIKIVPGTDGFAGFTLHRELELYVRSGIPTAAVLQMATRGAAEVAGKSDSHGSISEGKKADLLLVDGNPLENISHIRRTVMVMKDGKLYDSKKLFAAISIR